MRRLNWSRSRPSSCSFSCSTDFHEVHSLSSHHRPLNKGGGEGLCSSQGEASRASSSETPSISYGPCPAGSGLQYSTPPLTFTHTNFEGLLGDRLVREYADPDLAATLHVTGQRTTRGLDLTSSKAATASGLQCVLTEADLTTTMSQTTVVAGHLFAELRTLGLQHLRTPYLAAFYEGGCYRLQLFLAATDDLALEDPNLDTDRTVSGVRFVGGMSRYRRAGCAGAHDLRDTIRYGRFQPHPDDR